MMKNLRAFARSVREVFPLRPPVRSKEASALPPILRSSELRLALAPIPDWQAKLAFYNQYCWSESERLWLLRLETISPSVASTPSLVLDSGESLAHADSGYTKIHYGCGSTLLDGWLNVDAYPSELISAKNYRQVNLLDSHPYAAGSIRFGFAEDVIEHFSQAESIFFLSEVFRSLAMGGVLRLSFPGLEGVLDRHYTPPASSTISTGKIEAYSLWDHHHFYSRGELELVAKHLGFSHIQLVDYGLSEFADLTGLDTRSEQIGLNTYVELTK